MAFLRFSTTVKKKNICPARKKMSSLLGTKKLMSLSFETLDLACLPCQGEAYFWDDQKLGFILLERRRSRDSSFDSSTSRKRWPEETPRISDSVRETGPLSLPKTYNTLLILFSPCLFLNRPEIHFPEFDDGFRGVHKHP